MARLILDSGAIFAWASGSERVRRFVQRAVAEQALVLVPAVVVAETTRGGARDAPVNRVLKAIDEIDAIGEITAREAGRLLAARRNSNVTIDALVVATAARREPTIILTGDLADITALAAGYRHVRVEGI